MDWAKDYQGVIIQARRGAYIGFGLTCPTCGEPVILRAGRERRPHFAHYNKRAKPDCEYYYPSSDVLKRFVSRLPSNNLLLLSKRDSLRCGLFLAYRPEPTGFELFLRIPSLDSVQLMNGSLQIQHGKGLKEFTVKQLTRAYMIPILPMVPLLECIGTGDLLALSEHLISQTGSFLHGMNLFSAAESGGRFLFTQEQLEWGGRYWVVTDVPITPPDQVTAIIKWSLRGSLGNWNVYEAELPATKIASGLYQDEKILADFFCRTIRPSIPRAYLVHPSPHHLASDGAFVYPQAPEIIYVRRTSNSDVSVEGPPDLIAGTRIFALADDWVQIYGIQLGTQDVAILINDVEQVVIRSEACDLIQPSGLCAYTLDASWNLLTETPLTTEQLFTQEVRVECGSNRLAEYVSKINNTWIRQGHLVKLMENIDKTLIAGGFGEIRPAKLQETEHEIPVLSQKNVLTKWTWIEGLILVKHGPKMACIVRELIANPNQGDLQKLGLILTSPLIAYICAAVEFQQQQQKKK